MINRIDLKKEKVIGTSWWLNADTLVALSIFICSLSILFYIGGGPVSNDEMSYMYLAWFDQEWYTHLNRYIHVYFLKFFMWIMDDPFQGARLAWAFVMSACLGMTYFGVKLLNSRSSYLIGIVALLFFLSQSSVFRYVGVTYSDYTLMFWVTIAFLLLIHGLKQPENKNYLHAFLLGALFVLAVKSKESGVILLLPVVAIIFIKDGVELTIVFRRLLCVVGGGVTIIVGLMILDTIFLENTFFSVSFDNIAGSASYYIRSWSRSRGNWISYLFLSEIAFMFALYLISSFSIIVEIIIVDTLLFIQPTLLHNSIT